MKRIWAAGVGIFLLLLLVQTQPALSYSQEPWFSCNDPSIHFEFDDSEVTWSSSKKSLVRAAFDKLNNPLDRDGSQLVSVTEDSGVRVLLVELGQNTWYGHAECFSVRLSQSTRVTRLPTSTSGKLHGTR